MTSKLGTPPDSLTARWLAAIVDSSDDAIVSKTLDGTVTSWNPAAEKLFGYTADEMVGRPISILAGPGREDEMPAILERLRHGEKIDHYETIRRRKDGTLVDISLTVSPIHDGAGHIVGASKIARDITEHKRIEAALRESEQRFRMLAAELSHRVKNMLAVVQVLAERSGSKATSAAEFLEAFRGRLQALSAAHNALMASDWRATSLSSLIQTALEPYLGSRDQVRLELQDLPLDPDVALTLALGLHELATNAAKYGALSTPTGRVTLAARLEAGENGDELRLVWQEEGGPSVRAPKVAGFGTTMLSRAIEYQHKGRVELNWRRAGLVCRLTLPITEVAGSLAWQQ